MALFNLLKTGDMHSENIIALKDNPMLIDLETLVSNDNTDGLEDNLLLSYLKEINDSVLGCYILPQNLEYSTIDIDLSGLSGDKGKKSNKITYLELKDRGTDNIRFEKEFFVSSDNCNKATLNGNSLNTVNYMKYIEKGFNDVYDLIMENQQSFKEIIVNSLKDGKYRQVLRPTYIYNKYLQASYHPKYLKSIDQRKKLFNILIESEIKSGNNKKIEKGLSEVDALIKGDIPYFENDFLSTNIYANGSKLIEDYFSITIEDVITKKIQRVNNNEKEKQISYIRNSLLTTKDNIFNNDLEYGEHIDIVKDDIDLSLKNIAEYIYSKAIFNKDRTSCTYPNLNIHGSKILIGPINSSLYDGGGLVLFLYSLANEYNEEKYYELAKASLRGLEELCIEGKENSMPASAYYGIGSLAYLYYNISCLTNDKDMYKKYLYYMTKLVEYDLKDEECIDIIGGAAGIILFALNIYTQSKCSMAFKVADKFSKHLYEHLKNLNEVNFLSGFAHGYSGFALALVMAGSIMNKEEYYKLSLEIVKKEDILYRDDIKNWIDLRSKDKSALNYWCHGAPGILLARAKMTRYLNNDDKIFILSKVEEALEGMIDTAFLRKSNHSLCHGALGNIDILRVIYNELGLSELNKVYKEKLALFLEYMSEDGIKYGLHGTLAMVNFMTGLSGIGYSILREKNISLPSILALEVINGGEYHGDCA